MIRCDFCNVSDIDAELTIIEVFVAGHRMALDVCGKCNRPIRRAVQNNKENRLLLKVVVMKELRDMIAKKRGIGIVSRDDIKSAYDKIGVYDGSGNKDRYINIFDGPVALTDEEKKLTKAEIMDLVPKVLTAEEMQDMATKWREATQGGNSVENIRYRQALITTKEYKRLLLRLEQHIGESALTLSQAVDLANKYAEGVLNGKGEWALVRVNRDIDIIIDNKLGRVTNASEDSAEKIKEKREKYNIDLPPITLSFEGLGIVSSQSHEALHKREKASMDILILLINSHAQFIEGKITITEHMECMGKAHKAARQLMKAKAVKKTATVKVNKKKGKKND